MKLKHTYSELISAYSDENLNRITANLILLYRNRDFSEIRKIANRVSKYVSIEEEKDARCFSRLIMLYHPDKGEQFRKEIQRLYEKNDSAGLRLYSHIHLLSDLEVSAEIVSDLDVDYHPEYVWDESFTGEFSFWDAEEEGGSDVFDFERSFFNMIKIREYGDLSVELPYYYLEDLEDFEMAACGLESLDGVEHCRQIKILDVSNNALSDPELLGELEKLEELYLGNNRLGYIDSLSNLLHLRILDISGNQVDDISPLLELESLEYVNLSGNPVPSFQLEMLMEKGILVIR